MKKQITKTEQHPITEHRINKTTRTFGRRLLTAALNGIWRKDGDEDSKSVAEFLNIGISGDRDLRKKYNIATLNANAAFILNLMTDDPIEVEGVEHEWPIIGYEDVTYTRYSVHMDAYEEWYRANNPSGAWLLDKSKPYCWVEKIRGLWACNVSFDDGTAVGKVPAYFLTSVYEE